jgi:hypothetical protein
MMRIAALYYLIGGWLFFIAANISPAQTSPPPNVTTNLEQKVGNADLIVTGQFLAATNDRKAKAPIKILEILKGGVGNETRVAACFRANALTVSPKIGSKWIFFLLKPYKTEDGMEYRKIAGKNQDDKELMLSDDYEGIFPSTEENIKAVEGILAQKAGTHQ